MCSQRKNLKTKIVRIGGDRYFQKYEMCSGCGGQFNKQVTELKKGPYRAKAN